MQLVFVLCIPASTIPTCSSVVSVLCLPVSSIPASKVFVLVSIICILCRHSCTGKVCMINNRVYYVELLVDSNCVSSLEKRGCSHAQLIIESRQRMN